MTARQLYWLRELNRLGWLSKTDPWTRITYEIAVDQWMAANPPLTVA